MKTFLDRMRELKYGEISRRAEKIPIEALREQAGSMQPPPSLWDSLVRKEGKSPGVIAEVKARAPGRVNVTQFDPVSVVQDYVTGGASAISVLTDELWFGGSLETLKVVSESVQLPLLHKEFIVSEYQLLEGRIQGASASLILAYYFNVVELKHILEVCQKWCLEPVVECSLEKELPRVLEVNPRVLMINNRAIATIPEEPKGFYQQGSVDITLNWWHRHKNLRQWKTQLERLLISASCIDGFDDIRRLMEIPCDACLVGNTAMTAPDRVTFLRSLRGEPEPFTTKQDA